MNLGSVTKAVNAQTEESFSSSQVLEFISDAIAKINIECGANFPYFDAAGAEYTAFPDKWQRSLVMPFVVGRIKQVDSSQFEYTDSYGEFESNLLHFKVKYKIPDNYKDSNESKRFEDNMSMNPWVWSKTNGSGPLEV